MVSFSVELWSPSASLTEHSLTSAPVWLTLHRVPPQLWSEEGVALIASGVGTPLPLANPSSLSAVAAPRIRAIVPLNKGPLPTAVIVEDEEGGQVSVDIIYSSLPPLCPSCKKYGHKSHRCPLRAKAPPPPVRNRPKPPREPLLDSQSPPDPVAPLLPLPSDPAPLHSDLPPHSVLQEEDDLLGPVNPLVGSKSGPPNLPSARLLSSSDGPAQSPASLSSSGPNRASTAATIVGPLAGKGLLLPAPGSAQPTSGPMEERPIKGANGSPLQGPTEVGLSPPNHRSSPLAVITLDTAPSSISGEAPAAPITGEASSASLPAGPLPVQHPIHLQLDPLLLPQTRVGVVPPPSADTPSIISTSEAAPSQTSANSDSPPPTAISPPSVDDRDQASESSNSAASSTSVYSEDSPSLITNSASPVETHQPLPASFTSLIKQMDTVASSLPEAPFDQVYPINSGGPKHLPLEEVEDGEICSPSIITQPPLRKVKHSPSDHNVSANSKKKGKRKKGKNKLADFSFISLAKRLP